MNATEHLVVIIDAGSRGISRDAQWKTSNINTKMIRNFWESCDEASAPYRDIQSMWHSHWTDKIDECFGDEAKQWQSCPFLTETQESTCAIWQAMIAKESFRRSEAHTTSAYKIVELVGRLTIQKQRSDACASICYKTFEQLRSGLFYPGRALSKKHTRQIQR